MKKLILILSCCALMLSLAACGEKPADDKLPENTQGTVDSQPDSVPEDDEQLPDEDPEAPAVEIADGLELLTNVWNAYPEEEKFAVCGGADAMNAPGAYNLADTTGEFLDNMLCFPQESFDQIDDAASLMHMMNQNTFTSSVYRLTDAAANQADLVQKIYEKITTRQWICGAPQKFFIAHIGDYVISAYGHEDILPAFRTRLAEAYPDVVFDYEEDIVF